MPSVSRLYRQCGNLNISKTYGPPWNGTGTALLSLLLLLLQLLNSLQPIFSALASFSLTSCYTVDRIPWTGDQPVQGLYLHTRQHKQNKEHRHPCLKWDYVVLCCNPITRYP
jgi:hypothetical protein